jgi:hypothetical protein
MNNIAASQHEKAILFTKRERSSTRKCQPHASVRSITSFFGKQIVKKEDGHVAQSQPSVKKQKKNKQDLRSFFGK